MRSLISFGIGMYTGIFLAQNFDVPKVQNPKEIFDSIMKSIRKD